MVTSGRVKRYARFFDLPGSHQAFIKAAQLIVPKNLDSFIQKIRHITIPTLILWGQNDPVIPVDHAEKFYEDIIGSKLKIIPSCGHVPPEEKPLETARIIREFLDT